MRVVVAMDSSGHLVSAPRGSRDTVIKILMDVMDGDLARNVASEWNLDLTVNPWSLGLEEWNEFLWHFNRTGLFQIVKLKQ